MQTYAGVEHYICVEDLACTAFAHECMKAMKSMPRQLCQQLRHHVAISVSMQDITPLHIAAQKGDLQAAQSLLAHGADVNAKVSKVWKLFSHTVDSWLIACPQSLATYLFPAGTI